MLFEIGYEHSRGSGSVLIRSDTADEAAAKFVEEWSDCGDDVPSYWLTGACWSEENNA